MAFTKSQQSYAFFALLFGGVFFACVIVTQLESSPFPDGETTTGTVTGVETRGDGIVTKKKSTTLVEFVDSAGVTQQGKIPNAKMKTGRQFPISYRPQNPTIIRDLSSGYSPTQSFYTLLVVGTIIVIALIVLLHARLNRIGGEESKRFSISPLRTAGLIGAALVIVAVGFWVHNSQRTAETTATVVALEQPSLEVSRRVYVSYTGSNGNSEHAWIDSDTQHQVGDQLPHTYTPPMGDVTQLVGRFPWMQNVMIFASLPLLIFLTPKHIFDKTKKQER